MKKKLKGFTPFIVVGVLGVVIAIKAIQSAFGIWQQRIQPLLQPTLIECKTNQIFSQELTRGIQTAVQDYSTDRLITSFNPQELYKKLKERFKTVKSLTYELQAPNEIKITIFGVKPKLVINNCFVLADRRRLFLNSDFQDFNLNELPHLSVASSWYDEKLAPVVHEFANKVSAAMWERFNIVFASPEQIMLTPNQSACPFKIVADHNSVFDEKKYEQVNHVFNDLVRKEQITQRMLAGKECGIVFDIRFDNRVYVKFLNKSRRGGRW